MYKLLNLKKLIPKISDEFHLALNPSEFFSPLLNDILYLNGLKLVNANETDFKYSTLYSVVREVVDEKDFNSTQFNNYYVDLSEELKIDLYYRQPVSSCNIILLIEYRDRLNVHRVRISSLLEDDSLETIFLSWPLQYFDKKYTIDQKRFEMDIHETVKDQLGDYLTSAIKAEYFYILVENI